MRFRHRQTSKIDFRPSPLMGEGKGEGDPSYLPPSPPSSPTGGEEVSLTA